MGKLLRNDFNLSDSLGKLPPQAVLIEEAVLGAIMLEKEAIITVSDILIAESFYREAHKDIYEAIIQLFSDSKNVDTLTVVEQLRKNGKLELVGGVYYISELTTKVSSAANIEEHARIIQEKYMKRELIRIASDIHQKAYEDTYDVFNLIDESELEIIGISESNLKNEARIVGDIVRDVQDQFYELHVEQKAITGVPSGFMEVDETTGGWQKSDLIIIAGRPGMGKTSFLLEIFKNAALHGHPGVIFSLEMSSQQLVNRLVASSAELNSKFIRNGRLEQYQIEQLEYKGFNKIAGLPLYIDDTPALSPNEIRSRSIKYYRKYGIELIGIDYIQLEDEEGESETVKVTNISKKKKRIAKELNIPIIALSQLNRSVESRGGDKKPQLSDLRQSGAIEENADLVGFLYRPEYYKITENENGDSLRGVAYFNIEKHRNGELAEIPLKFVSKYTKFLDYIQEETISSQFPTNNF